MCDRRGVTHTAAAALLCALLLAPVGARAAVSGRALQEKRLEDGKAALERLRNDAKRRKRRDAWQAVIRELDGALRAAPGGSRAPEVALAAARAREELWNVSRSRRDAAAAVAAYRAVDQAYTGTPQAPRALLAAARLAQRAGDVKSAGSATRRLAARYGGTPEARAVAALPRIDRPKTKARANRPAEVEEEEDDDDNTSAVDEPNASSTDAGERPAASAGARKNEEDDSRAEKDEIPAQAAKLVDHVIEAARAQGTAARDDGDDEALPPEPEAPEPIDGLTVKAALPPREEPSPTRASAATRARELRAAARKAPASVAAQLGLKVKRVVIDPGHGGRDTGAIGPHGVREKDVALAIARTLAERLRELGFTVVLTRKDDTYVSLDERTRIANEARADLFVSVHCNAARSRKLAGVETWTLNVASDRYATRLATFENADAERTVSDLRLILADLATRANTTDARELAQSVQESLVRTLRSRVGRVGDHDVKHALFYVLLGARMPAILVETGFISNPVEESRLRTRKYQASTAEAIARGVKEFVDGRQRLARAP